MSTMDETYAGVADEKAELRKLLDELEQIVKAMYTALHAAQSYLEVIYRGSGQQPEVSGVYNLIVAALAKADVAASAAVDHSPSTALWCPVHWAHGTVGFHPPGFPHRCWLARYHADEHVCMCGEGWSP